MIANLARRLWAAWCDFYDQYDPATWFANDTGSDD